MKNVFSLPWFLPLLLLFGGKSALSQDLQESYYQQWIDYQDGEITMAFNQTPVEIAVDAIRVRTGLQIIVPPAMGEKRLSLHLSRLPLEPAVRSFIDSIGFKNFALMYDEEGRPNRAVVLGTASVEGTGRATGDARSTQGAEPLGEKEREQLNKQLERWSELKQEERGRIEDRLKTLPPTEEREQLIAEYGRQLLGIKKRDPSVQ